MAKQSWNDFVKAHTSHLVFCAAVSASLPPAAQFDRNKKKLPSPYGLFNEWAKNSLKGDWSSTKVAGGFCVAVSAKQDAILIQETFGLLAEPIVTPLSRETLRIGYSNSSYPKLARSLGYAV